jgi:MOSC domain-containing protein YiiM
VRLGFDRHRPSCAYLASLTERRLPKALTRYGCGIGVRVLEGGPLRVGDAIEDLGPDPDLWSMDFERFRRAFG